MPERWNVTDKIEDPRANWKHLYQYPNYCLVGGTLASGVVFEPNAVLAEVRRGAGPLRRRRGGRFGDPGRRVVRQDGDRYGGRD